MAAPAAVAVYGGGMKVLTSSQAYLESKAVKDTRVLIADLCRQFYTLGWVSGTGGSITSKVHDDSIPKPQQLILMSPSGKSSYICSFDVWGWCMSVYMQSLVMWFWFLGVCNFKLNSFLRLIYLLLKLSCCVCLFLWFLVASSILCCFVFSFDV